MQCFNKLLKCDTVSISGHYRTIGLTFASYCVCLCVVCFLFVLYIYALLEVLAIYSLVTLSLGPLFM